MSKLIFLSILCLTALSLAGENDYKTDKIEKIVLVNVATDSIVTDWKGVRAIKADIGGNIKIRIKSRLTGDSTTTVETLPDAVWLPVGSVKKIWALYNGTDSTTCQSYNSSGVLVRGIKLGY